MNKKAIQTAIKALKAGKVVAFPTETVFGLGALLTKSKAIKKLYKIKKRPRNKPLQVLVANLAQAKELGKFNARAERLAKKNWPGPLTLVVYKTSKVSRLITGGTSKVGLRIPAHRKILKLIKEAGPIVATSANKTGEPPALTLKAAKKKVAEADFFLPGRVKIARASKVIDATTGFRQLRP